MFPIAFKILIFSFKTRNHCGFCYCFFFVVILTRSKPWNASTRQPSGEIVKLRTVNHHPNSQTAARLATLLRCVATCWVLLAQVLSLVSLYASFAFTQAHSHYCLTFRWGVLYLSKQSQTWWTTVHIKMSLIYILMNSHFHGSSFIISQSIR